MRDRLLTAFLSLMALALAGVIGLYLWSLRAVNATGPLTQPTVLIIKPGTGLSAIAHQLDEANVVLNKYLFEWEARRTEQARDLKPGEYKFDAGISLSAVLDKLVKRDVVARFVTIPEGLVSAEIAKIINTAEGLEGAPVGGIADGDLLPETYRYEWGDTKAAFIDRMRKARTALLNELWEKRATDLPITTPEQAMVLASIVEKETGVAAERPMVAGVFINRLKKKMRLQSDPTVIYGLQPGGLDRELTRADLATATPFNTYVIDGLPPSPIAHPGRASIAAVLNPAPTDALYFVADGTGGHAFAATLAEHNKNVARWRKLNDAALSKSPAPQTPAQAK
jgi:UPF0755 protein